MRKFALLLVLTALIGCQQQKKEIIRLQAVKDSLNIAAMEKDSAIVGFLSDFNEIQANLDSIKKMEKLVTVATERGVELRGSRKQQVMEDISLINDLLQKNKALNESLQKKLNSATFKIGKLEGMITEFEVMVSSLNQQIQEKDAEIVRLNQDLTRLNLDVANLTQKVEDITQENVVKTQTIESQTLELNKAYYAFGTVKELKDNGVLERTGGVIGVGSTMRMKKDFNRDYFSEIDIRNFSYLPLNVKKAKIITVHPVGSYHVSGEKTADTLFIDNSQDFWKASKYLLVVID